MVSRALRKPDIIAAQAFGPAKPGTDELASKRGVLINVDQDVLYHLTMEQARDLLAKLAEACRD
jgi:hypothetical protein